MVVDQRPDSATAVALLLALEVAAGGAVDVGRVEARGMLSGGAVLLGREDRQREDHVHGGHRREDRPALAADGRPCGRYV